MYSVHIDFPDQESSASHCRWRPVPCAPAVRLQVARCRRKDRGGDFIRISQPVALTVVNGQPTALQLDNLYLASRQGPVYRGYRSESVTLTQRTSQIVLCSVKSTLDKYIFVAPNHSRLLVPAAQDNPDSRQHDAKLRGTEAGRS
jgi:hypothetical protein